MTRLNIDLSTGEISTREELNSGYYEADVIAKIVVNGDEELLGKTLVIIDFLDIFRCTYFLE